MNRLTAPALLTLIALTLAACGGGSSTTTSQADQVPQTIVV